MSRTIKHKKSLCPVLGSIKKTPCPVPQNASPVVPINNEQSLESMTEEPQSADNYAEDDISKQSEFV